MRSRIRRSSAALQIVWGVALAMLISAIAMGEEAKLETLAQIGARLGAETKAAYEASPFSALSKDYFSRFSRDPDAKPAPDETAIGDNWTIATAPNAQPLTTIMAGHLVEFLTKGMGLTLPVQTPSTLNNAPQTIVLLDGGGGREGAAESFTLTITEQQVTVRGHDAAGLRDGVVKLVEQIGFRQAPYLKRGEQVYTPRLTVRLGATPNFGKTRDLVFMGYNAVFTAGGSLFELSTSDAIPELKARRAEGSLKANTDSGAEARKYGMKTYCFVNIRQKFPKDDPIFTAHPEIRGALTWKADGEYVLCTEHPLVKQWLTESVEGIFKADPELSGLVLIIGGESFYHCFMRPFGVEKGHTNCPRCEAIGADKVVSNLMNNLAEAAHKVNPKAEVIGWPYSAVHVWSSDKAQSGMIKLLKPGTGIFTEMEKDEFVEKPEGVKKSLWDYSIDLIGPGDRAKQQIAACKAAGISIYVKSEPEDAYEAPRLPEIPCLDRWADRAEALASC
ncbi:MAG: hypothetical protein HZB26_26705, partial [Candidatus Hydrogenedentes bacterium]|nr:hypothetical protein [Candidatus Hydrogenedentota bacterium]